MKNIYKVFSFFSLFFLICVSSLNTTEAQETEEIESYTFTIPSELSLNNNGQGQLEISGEYTDGGYDSFVISISSKNNFKLINDEMIELDYSLSSDDDDFDDEYVYTPENSSFNTIISVSITTDSILYSGLYKDTLTFEVNAVPKVIESLTNNSDIYEQEIIKEEMNIEPIENDTNDDSCTVYLYADEDILSKYIIEESEIFVDDNKEDNIYTASAIFKTDEVEELSLLPAISKKEGTKLEAHWIKQSELQTKDVYYTVVIKEIELIETVEEDIEN